MLFKNPPEVNGLMQLEEKEILSIQTELINIQAEFVPTEDEPILSTHGLVSRFNDLCEDGCQINGDTAEFILSYTEQ